MILQTQRPPYSSHLKAGKTHSHSSLEKFFQEPLQEQNFVSLAEHRMRNVLERGSLNHTLVFEKLDFQSGVHILPSTGPYRHRCRAMRRHFRKGFPCRYLAERTWPNPSAAPSSAVPGLTRCPICQTLGFLHVGETTNPEEVSAPAKKN